VKGDAEDAVPYGEAVDPLKMLGVVAYCGVDAAAVGKALLGVVNGVCSEALANGCRHTQARV
jgi:hypothetical protein